MKNKESEGMRIRTKAITSAQQKELCKKLSKADALALKLMRETGLRVSDILNLRAEELDIEMQIVERKTKKERRIKISKKLLKDLKSYKKGQSGYLFTSSRSTLYRHLHKAALEKGWENISAHSARKAYARAYARKYGLEATQKDLGHKYISTTMLYVFGDDLAIPED